MNMNDLIQQWGEAVDAIQTPAAHESALRLGSLQVRTSITAGEDEGFWRKTWAKEVCRYGANGFPTGECTSCTDTWTESPC